MKKNKCIRCGECCQQVICGVGVTLCKFDPDKMPCPALEKVNGKATCRLVIDPKKWIAIDMPPGNSMDDIRLSISRMLRIGRGCTSNLEKSDHKISVEIGLRCKRLRKLIKKKISEKYGLFFIAEKAARNVIHFKYGYAPLLNEIKNISYSLFLICSAICDAANGVIIFKDWMYRTFPSQFRQIVRDRIDAIERMGIECNSWKSESSRIRWGVGIPVGERSLFFNRRQIKKIIQLRQEGIYAGQVRELLKCTQSDLDRWDRLNLLPHAYKYPLIVPTGSSDFDYKTVMARCWLFSDVEYFKKRIDLIRIFN